MLSVSRTELPKETHTHTHTVSTELGTKAGGLDGYPAPRLRLAQISKMARFRCHSDAFLQGSEIEDLL